MSQSSLPFRIKICGITDVKDGLSAVELGADAIGLNFYAKSLRSVSPVEGIELAAALSGKAALVGVFVNHSAEDIVEISEHLRLEFVQLHGDETPDLTGSLNPLGLPVIRAIRIGSNETASIASAQSQIDEWTAAGVAGFLLDKQLGREYGGTGHTFDWEIVSRLHFEKPFVLAGGLTDSNVASGIAKVSPAAVDTASGVESLPGKKDLEKLTRFVEAAKAAFDSGQ